ncbi:MAG: esterase [Polyangiales bacterium]
MTSKTSLPLRMRAFGGDDGEGRGDGPAILLCHGFGAPGDDLVSLARVIDAGPSVRWFFPEAPLEIDVGGGAKGRAWWPIDMIKLQMLIASGRGRGTMTEETPDGLLEAREALEHSIDSLSVTHGVNRGRLLIGGFSQGAMLTTDIALSSEIPFAGLAILSGTLRAAPRGKQSLEKSGPGLHVFQSHGKHDPLLPFEIAETLRAHLEASRASVEWVPFQGQHEIPMPILGRLGAFARRRFAALPLPVSPPSHSVP